MSVPSSSCSCWKSGYLQPGQRQDLEEKPQIFVGEQQTSLESVESGESGEAGELVESGELGKSSKTGESGDLVESVESGETGELGESGESKKIGWQRETLSEKEFVTFSSSDYQFYTDCWGWTGTNQKKLEFSSTFDCPLAPQGGKESKLQDRWKGSVAD